MNIYKHLKVSAINLALTLLFILLLIYNSKEESPVLIIILLFLVVLILTLSFRALFLNIKAIRNKTISKLTFLLCFGFNLLFPITFFGLIIINLKDILKLL